MGSRMVDPSRGPTGEKQTAGGDPSPLIEASREVEEDAAANNAEGSSVSSSLAHSRLRHVDEPNWKHYLWCAFGLVLLPALLFGGAGSLRWPDGLTFSAINIVIGVMHIVYLKNTNPELLKKRLSLPFRNDQPVADRVFIALMFPLGILGYALIGADVVRFHWTPHHWPSFLQSIGYMLLALGHVMVFLTFEANRFANAVIAPQEGQAVVSTGAYAYVRHPMYSGAMFYALSVSLILNSFVALLWALLISLALFGRIQLEEAFLLETLPGYREYCNTVKYRLMPYVI